MRATRSSTDKTLLKIPNANHNDILLQGFGEYMAGIAWAKDVELAEDKHDEQH